MVMQLDTHAEQEWYWFVRILIATTVSHARSMAVTDIDDISILYIYINLCLTQNCIA